MLEDAEIDRVIRQMRNSKNRISPEGRKACKFLIEQLVARGYKRKEIAENLGVSVKTVYNILNAYT